MIPTNDNGLNKQQNQFTLDYNSNPIDYHEIPEINESFEQFFNKEFLSDCVVIDPRTSKKVRSHSILLASRSELFNSHFKKHNEIISNVNMKNPHKIQLPISIEVKTQNIQPDIFEKCINYFYTSNLFDFLIQNGFNANNCFWFYAYFHILDHHIAIHQIEDYIIDETIKPMNVISCLLEALKFKSQRIIEKCLEIIEMNFEGLSRGKENSMRMKELPFEVFKKILASNDLKVEKEETVLQIIIDYINFREKEPENPEFLKKSEKSDGAPPQIPKDEKPKEEKLKEVNPKDEKPKEENSKEEKPKEKLNEEKPKPKEEIKKDGAPPKEGPPKEIEKGENDPKAPPKQPKQEEGSYLLGDFPDMNDFVKDLFKIYKLSPGEKFELLSCCRLSYIEHELLLKASNVSALLDFKNLFIEAISAKLNNYENATHNYSINLNPRESYREMVENQKNMNLARQPQQPMMDPREMQENQKNINMNINRQPQQSLMDSREIQENQKNMNRQQPQHGREMVENQNNMNMNRQPQQPIIDPRTNQVQLQGKKEIIKEDPSPQLPISQNQIERGLNPETNFQFNQNTNPNFFKSMQGYLQNNLYPNQSQIQDRNLESSPPSGLKTQEYLKPYVQKNLDKYSTGLSKSQEIQTIYTPSEVNANPKIYATPQGSRSDKKEPIESQIIPKSQFLKNYSQGPTIVQNLDEGQNNNSFHPENEEKMYNQSNIKQPSYRYEEIEKIKTAQSLSPLEFIYKYDFDDNGVIYYLGSYGKTKKWVNPHELKLVEVNFSSVGVGIKIEDFIGRECVNCCTKNEKNAFMSLDLGEGRHLFPSCYTIRNRPSRKYVLMNWIIEASVNNNEWYIIDKRINFTEDPHFNSLMEKEREELLQKGQTSTWGIDLENVENILNDLNRKSKLTIKGFRFFRVTQLMKNSDGEFNLCLSGFEVYGTGHGTKWYF